jgi:hypothetical protein
MISALLFMYSLALSSILFAALLRIALYRKEGPNAFISEIRIGSLFLTCTSFFGGVKVEGKDIVFSACRFAEIVKEKTFKVAGTAPQEIRVKYNGGACTLEVFANGTLLTRWPFTAKLRLIAFMSLPVPLIIFIGMILLVIIDQFLKLH